MLEGVIYNLFNAATTGLTLISRWYAVTALFLVHQRHHGALLIFANKTKCPKFFFVFKSDPILR